MRDRSRVEFLVAAIALLSMPAIASVLLARDRIAPFSVNFALIALVCAVMNVACLPAVEIAYEIALLSGTRRHRIAARCANIAVVLSVLILTWGHFGTPIFDGRLDLRWCAATAAFYALGSVAIVAVCASGAAFVGLGAALWTRLRRAPVARTT